MTSEKSGSEVKSVNQQITDAITQSNVIATALAPANSMAMLYQTFAQSTGTALQNAVSHQQHVNTLNLASLSKNVETILQQPGSKNVVQTLQPIILQQPQKPERKPTDSSQTR
ncbi:MAG: RebB family R body protein [Sneathiella sp.]|nr:RebB family R body protein [Sneathiella sp.]